MAKRNKKCVCCGKVYSYCNTCGSDLSKPSWMNTYCSENCMTLFMAATDYKAGLISKREAAEIVKKADITNKDSFNNGVKSFIDEVSTMRFSKTVPNKGERIEAEDVVDTEVEPVEDIDEKAEEAVKEEVETEPKRSLRRRNRRKDNEEKATKEVENSEV